MAKRYKEKESKRIVDELNSLIIDFEEDNRHVRVMGKNIESIFSILQEKILSKKGPLTEDEIKELCLGYEYCKTALFYMQVMNTEFLVDTMDKLDENIQKLIELNNIKINEADGEKFNEKIPGLISLDFEGDYSRLKN